MGSCGCSTSSSAGMQAILQGILEELSNYNVGSGPVMVPIPIVSLDAATIGADTDYHLILNNSQNKKYIQIINDMDQAIYASLDDSSDHFYINGSGGSQTLPLGQLNTYWNGNVWVRSADGSNLPTTGDVKIHSFA